MRQIFFPIFFLLCVISDQDCFSQSWSEVKESGNYYYGEGWGKTIEEANQEALANLIQQFRINVSVKSLQSHKRHETNGRNANETSTFQTAINTYAQATLDNTLMIVISTPPNAHVVRWIKKSDVDKVFQSRRVKIHSLIERGERAEQKGKIDVAIRCYYWAFALLKSLPDGNAEVYNGNLLTTWLPNKMEDVLSEVKATIRKTDGNDIEIGFIFRGKPINSVDFSYNDGGVWSNICSAKDGIGLIYLSPGTSADNINLQIEYEYRGQAMLDPEIQSVLNVTPEFNLAKAFINAKSDDLLQTIEKPNSTVSESFTEIESEFFSLPQSITDSEKNDFETKTTKVISAIKNQKFDDVRNMFTPEGFSIFNKLIRYGQARIVGKTTLDYTSNGVNTFCRGLQMSFRFKNGVRRNFVEDIVFTYDKDGLICNVSFGLGKTTLDDILGQSAYPENVRMQLVDFLENYQTAFALKRLDYISTIFDEDAIIIVGTEVKRSQRRPLDGGYQFSNNKFIKYNRYDKASYLERLKRSFASKEFINLRFNSTRVRKALNGGELYGIQIEQDYYSSNYGDHGYLFLEININDPEKPLILVRTWQPEPDPQFGIYNESLFPVHSFE